MTNLHSLLLGRYSFEQKAGLCITCSGRKTKKFVVVEYEK